MKEAILWGLLLGVLHGATANANTVTPSFTRGTMTSTTDSFTINTYCDTNGNSTTRAPLTTDEIFNSSGTDLGSATAFTVDVVQPSIVVYMWKRTA